MISSPLRRHALSSIPRTSSTRSNWMCSAPVQMSGADGYVLGGRSKQGTFGAPVNSVPCWVMTSSSRQVNEDEADPRESAVVRAYRQDWPEMPMPNSATELLAQDIGARLICCLEAEMSMTLRGSPSDPYKFSSEIVRACREGADGGAGWARSVVEEYDSLSNRQSSAHVDLRQGGRSMFWMMTPPAIPALVTESVHISRVEATGSDSWYPTVMP